MDNVDSAPRLPPSVAIRAGDLLRRGQQVHNAIWAGLMPADLTSPQYALVAVLGIWPKIDQNQAGKLASLDKSSAADVAARLVERMWIARIRNPDDARRYVLTLTPAAALSLATLTPRARQVQQALMTPLPEPERPAFLEMLRQVARLEPERVSPRPAADAPAVLDLGAPGHLIRCAQQVHTAVWARRVGAELTAPQHTVVDVVRCEPGISQKRLGELAALDKSTVADIVLRLERKGWLRRYPNPDDRRGRLLELTRVASAELDALTARVREVEEELLAPLTPAAHRPFTESLIRIALRAGVVPDDVMEPSRGTG